MSRREKMLAGVIVALLALWVGKSTFERVSSYYDQRAQVRDTLRQQTRQETLKVERGLQADRRLKHWREMSLTADFREARSQYQQWLRHCVQSARLRNANVDSESRVVRHDGYRELTFTLRGEASLDQITQFLYEFYRADYMHRIDRLHFAPKKGSKDVFDLTVTIAALIVDGVGEDDRSNPESIDRPRHGDLAAYRETIGGRNLFAAYVAPKPPAPVVERRPDPKPSPPSSPAFDDSKHTRLSALTSKSGVWSAWFQVRTTGEGKLLKVGDRLQVGTIDARVERIDSRQVVLATKDKRLLVDLGESVADAVILPGAGS